MKATELETISLYNKYRPRLLKDVVGQPEAVAVLRGYLANGGVPRVLLLTGPSGTGKTTTARILAKKVKCHEDDVWEVNAASSRGIDDVREIKDWASLSPRAWKNKVCIIDECHKLTNDAQSALLKTLEDISRQTYYILATTDPQKLLPTIKTRAAEVRFNAIHESDICALLAKIVQKEVPHEKYPPDEVLEKIASVSRGSARHAINELEKVLHLASADAQLRAIQSPEAEKVAFDLVKALLWEKPSWKKVQAVLAALADTNYEGIRQLVLANAENEMLKPVGSHDRAYAILMAFEVPFHDTRKSGLIRAAYEVFKGVE